MILDYARAVLALSEARPDVIVLVTHCGPALRLQPALASIAAQHGFRGRLAVLVGEDGGAGHLADAWASDVPGTVVGCALQAGSAARARNNLIALARRAAPGSLLIRLDSDDRLASPFVIAEVERRARRCARAGALLLGNLQCKGDAVLTHPNLPSHHLCTRRGLLARLDGMALGDPRAELPSCNLVLLPGTQVFYPHLSSAEDHALVAWLLAHGLVTVDASIIQTVYRLNGRATRASRRAGAYRAARRTLLRTICAV